MPQWVAWRKASPAVPAVRAAIRGVDPTVPIATVNRMTDLVAQNAATRRFALTVFQGFGIAALLLAALGLYGVLAASVTERTREIGIRKALGATRNNIQTQFLIEAMVLSFVGGALGILLGSAAAITLSRLAGWNTYISLTAIAVAFVFSAAVGLFFGILPARRAASLDPIVALRYE